MDRLTGIHAVREALEAGGAFDRIVIAKGRQDTRVEEIVRRFDLAGAIRPFTRCMACNALLNPVSQEEVRGLVPARIAEVYDAFLRCEQCGRVYWKGSHYDRMRQWVETLQASPLR